MGDGQITIENWIKANPDIEKILVEIQNMPISVEDQAQIAFDKLADHLQLPKHPDDIEDNDGTRCLFEEHALQKYMEPDDDPRGLVLNSIFFLAHGIGVDYEEVAIVRY
ncbi:MAG: hypothetical protein AAFY41_11825, partial [Bacteroidota bacterium]